MQQAMAAGPPAIPPPDAALLDLILRPGAPALASLPPVLALPAPALGDLPALLARTPAPAHEHGQYVDFDTDIRYFRASPLYTGAPNVVWAPDLRRPAPTLVERLGLRRRVRMLSWHTHPLPAAAAAWPAACPSLGDLCTISLLPHDRRSRLHMVGAASGVDALVIAQPPPGGFAEIAWSARGRPPVRLRRRRFGWLHDMRRRWQERRTPSPYDEEFVDSYRRFLAGVAAMFGLGYYQAENHPAPGRPLVLRRVEPVENICA